MGRTPRRCPPLACMGCRQFPIRGSVTLPAAGTVHAAEYASTLRMDCARGSGRLFGAHIASSNTSKVEGKAGVPCGMVEGFTPL
jgi:hypothetical protein